MHKRYHTKGFSSDFWDCLSPPLEAILGTHRLQSDSARAGSSARTFHSCWSHHGQLIRHTSNCRAAGNVCERVHSHIPLLPVLPRPAYTPYIPRTAEQLEMCVNVCTRTSHSCRSHHRQLIRDRALYAMSLQGQQINTSSKLPLTNSARGCGLVSALDPQGGATASRESIYVSSLIVQFT